MKLLKFIVIVLGFYITSAYADFSYDFVRIACIPEAGFISISHETIHNTPVDATPGITNTKQDFSIWENNGYFNPTDLKHECTLQKTIYKVVAKQGAWRERGQCGASPDVYFSLYRNNALIIDNVVFGSSCFGYPSITRLSIHDLDETSGYKHREANICFNGGKENNTDRCEWYLEQFDGFTKNFPINSESILRLYGVLPAANKALKAQPSAAGDAASGAP